MPNQEVENVLNACDELLSCKFLVAEYKITKVLKAIASSSDVCSLISECLESYNRDREFARTFIQDGHGQFACIMPTEEFKIVALVFCTLADIDNKKIDFTDFVKAYFGKEENRGVAEKLKQVFSQWIDNGHNDLGDENTIILCVKLTDGILLSHGTRYEF